MKDRVNQTENERWTRLAEMPRKQSYGNESASGECTVDTPRHAINQSRQHIGPEMINDEL